MTPEAMLHEFDVVVIGAGAVGENVAGRVLQGGLSAVLVEVELVGGECSYWACMPSKALLRPGAALHAAQTLPGAAEAVTRTLDAPAVLEHRDSLASNWQDDSQVQWVHQTGIELIRGHASLSGPKSVEVYGSDGSRHRLQARQAVVLATGSAPNTPPVEGLQDVQVWGTREATSAREVPQRLAVLGGGAAGTELAQAFARLGATVTLVARSKLLGSFPEEAVNLVAAGLRADGVEIRLHTSAESISQNDDGALALRLGDGSTLTADKVLVATGRHPALAGLGLESVGLETDTAGHFVLRTDSSGLVAGVQGGEPWLYAVGDAAGKHLYTHQGKYEARAAGEAIVARSKGGLAGDAADWTRAAQTANNHAVPSVVFTDPELATVGRSFEAARKDGYNTSSVELPIEVAGSALHSANYQGWAQLVIDEDRKVILGATFAGPGVAELLHAATIAIVGEVPLERLWHAVPAYPTISEVWLRLLEKYGL